MIVPKEKFILDACCGGRMMWFNKKHPNALYIDNRIAVKGHIQNGFNPNHEVNPDIVMDFRDLKFKDNTFKLVVFDPPHLSSLTETSIMRKKFGVLNKETWQWDLKKAFIECWRVLDDYGVLIIKWNDIERPYKTLLSLFSEDPLRRKRWFKWTSIGQFR
jgi:23S rRNA G2069 N7-methylase RlmK/C1962 C5-methylase RlmI